jgi:hypothetical protein
MTVGELREKLDEWGGHLEVTVRTLDKRGEYVYLNIERLDDDVNDGVVFIDVVKPL